MEPKENVKAIIVKFNDGSLHRVIVKLILETNVWRVWNSTQEVFQRGGYTSAGCLWYSKTDMESFERRALDLVANPSIESVSILCSDVQIEEHEGKKLLFLV